ncbi:histidine kinase-like protein [Aneurinibacillus soli]|uniref:Histidine kinase/HSP90-like ATPase domain-containing protein n=1 Tax=Aneurinibacillus soli TaxID=1500254 RepID=A0A0U5BEU2_9BACL|nr:ATP-binding protein [Aneurinibacillus soli]PYE59457.1 histidine kinase-like protein [Aneurinibacillus soli]BAU29213.1 hypothetical protein CB4_03398 [Aneurinibacillus soli]
MRNYEFACLTEQNLKSYVDQILFDLRADLDITQESLIHYSLYLAIWEILLNIVSHNQSQTDHHVLVRISWTEDEIMIQIEDPDGDFDWKTCLLADLPTPDQSTGRGLFIVKTISKEFSFEDCGKIARILFDRS